MTPAAACWARVPRSPVPPRWGWHFLPAALDFAYNAWAFALPLAAKERWYDGVHRPWIEPVEAAAALVSLGIYLIAAAGFYRRYRRWLAEHAVSCGGVRLDVVALHLDPATETYQVRHVAGAGL